MTRAEGTAGFFCFFCIKVYRIGIMKASVLPDPVQLSTARFERLIILGTTAFWTGKGREKSSLRSCSTISALRQPRSSQLVSAFSTYIMLNFNA